MSVVKIRDYQPKPAAYGVRHEDAADVIVLPVVRIERNPGAPDGLSVPPGRSRRRAPRSLLTLKQKMEALRAMQAVERGD